MQRTVGLAVSFLIAAPAAWPEPPDLAAVLHGLLKSARVAPEDCEKLEPLLTPAKLAAQTESYRASLRDRLYKAALDRLNVRMPSLLRKRIQEQVAALRSAAGLKGAASASELNRIHLAIMVRARPALVKALHERTDAIAAKAAEDRLLMAGVAARELADRVPYRRLKAFKEAASKEGLHTNEDASFAEAVGAVAPLVKAYQLDLTGIVDPGTGKVAAADEALASPDSERCLGAGVAPTLKEVVGSLELSKEVLKPIRPLLLARKVEEFRMSHWWEARERLFSAARESVEATMAEAMPKKMQERVSAIRSSLMLGGAPPEIERVRIRMGARFFAQRSMGPLVHGVADQVADEVAADDRLIADLRAAQIRAKLPEGKAAAFDEALKKAGIFGEESEYTERAVAAVKAAVAGYVPRTAGLVDPKTGNVVASEEVGVPARDVKLWPETRKIVRSAIEKSGLSDEDVGKLEVLVSVHDFEPERLSYCGELREKLSEAARKNVQALMPERMSKRIQPGISAIRERAGAGGPLSVVDRSRVRRAVMRQTRREVMPLLHAAAGELALKAVGDAEFLAGRLAEGLVAKLDDEKAAMFRAALNKAGLLGREAACIAEAEKRVLTFIEGWKPDLTGIIDPKTGEVIVEER